MRISWLGVNRIESGEVIREDESDFLVLLDNGKKVLIDKNSVRDELAVQ